MPKTTRMKNWLRFISASVLATGLCLSVSAGQKSESLLRGRIRNQAGQAVSGARLWLVGRTTSGVILRNLRTGKDGRFEMKALPPGDYAVRVSMEAYESKVEESLRLSAGEERWLELRLTPASGKRAKLRDAKKIAAEDWRWVLRTSGKTTRSLLRFLPGGTQSASSNRRPATTIAIGSATSPASGLLSDSTGIQISYTAPGGLSTHAQLNNGSSATGTGAFVSTQWQRGDFLQSQAFHFGAGYQILPSGHPLRTLAGARSARAYRAGTSQTLELPAHAELEYRLDFLRVTLAGGVTAILPVVELRRASGASTTFFFAHRSESVSSASLLALDSADTGQRRPVRNILPWLTRRAGRLRMERISHQEAGMQKHFGARSRLEAALFREKVTDSAILSAGPLPPNQALDATREEFLSNLAGTGLVLNGGHFSTTGFRLAFLTNWSGQLETMVTYVSSSGLAPKDAQLNTDQILREALEPRHAHAVGARIKTRLPLAKTRLRVDYRWISEPLLTNPDDAGSQETHMEPFLAVEVRQPVPAFFFLPSGFTILANAQNLLNQGGSNFTLADGTSIRLTPVQRSIRGGIAYRF